MWLNIAEIRSKEKIVKIDKKGKEQGKRMKLENDAIAKFMTAAITKEELADMVKLLSDKMMDATYHFLLRNDTAYKKYMEAVVAAEHALQETEISKEAKKVVDTLMGCMDSVNAESISMAYLAGMIDAYRILNNLGLIAE